MLNNRTLGKASGWLKLPQEVSTSADLQESCCPAQEYCQQGVVAATVPSAWQSSVHGSGRHLVEAWWKYSAAKWQSCILILGICALVQMHCEGDFGGTCSHILKLPYAMKVPFHEESHATSVVITCKLVIEMAQRRLLSQSCAVVRLLWEVLSTCCSSYVHGGTGSMQWGGGSDWFPRLAAQECDGAAAQEQGASYPCG